MGALLTGPPILADVSLMSLAEFSDQSVDTKFCMAGESVSYALIAEENKVSPPPVSGISKATSIEIAGG